MTAIDIADVHKTYRLKGGKVDALRGLSLSIGQGEVFGFLGPNGAGKTTTIKIMMGLIRPSAGQVRILGHDAGSALARKNVGYLPENPSFYDYLTAREYLVFIGKVFGMDHDHLRKRSEEVLKLLDLWDARNRSIRGYSKGMVQRLGLAQTLIHEPDVYVLDEPMSGLDPLGRALMKEVILGLKKKGKCVFFSTHITSDVEAVCDRVGIILGGTLRRLDRVDSILTEGIRGYDIRIRRANDSEQQSIRYVPKDELAKFMEDAVNSRADIALIEPRRKDLESFFLDIVKGSSS